MVYILILLICLFGILMIRNVIVTSRIRHAANIAPDLKKENTILKTQDVEFKIKTYPKVRLFNDPVGYGVDKQQLTITQKGIVLTAVVSGKEYGDWPFYFPSNEIKENAIKYGVVGVIDAWKQEGDELYIKTRESENFLPRYQVVRFDKYPNELAEIIKEKIQQKDFK